MITKEENELIEKFKPLMYCYAGSEMLSNTYNDNVALENAKLCLNITKQYADIKAKEKAIVFAEWVELNAEKLLNSEWRMWDELEEKWIKITTEELYNLFIEQ